MTAGSVARSYSMNAIDSIFQTAAVNSLRHCRARPGNPSSSKMVLRRLMDARVKPGHDECRHLDSRHTQLHPRGARTPKHAFMSPQRQAPEALINLSPLEGVGNAGCPWHPQPRVRFALVKSTRVTTSTPESPGIPARNGFNGFLRALPGDRALCHRRPRIGLV